MPEANVWDPSRNGGTQSTWRGAPTPDAPGVNSGSGSGDGSGGLGDVVLTGTPTVGQVPTATSATTAEWGNIPDGGGNALWFGQVFNPGVELSPIVGSIRNNGLQADVYDYWKLIDYSGHAPVGFRRAAGAGAIETTATYIRVHHDVGGNITAGVVAVLDETLAQTGLRLGTSVGEDYTDIYVYRDGYALLTLSAGGVWSSTYQNAGITAITWDAGNKYLVVDHAPFANPGINVTQNGGGSLGSWTVQASTVSNTQTRFYFIRNQGLVHSARIAWNGSAYAVVGNAQNLSVTSYDTGTGDLVLTATSGNMYGGNVALTAWNTATHYAVVRAQDATTITVNLYDRATNTKVAGSPTTGCAFAVTAQSRAFQSEAPDNGTNFAVRWNSRSQIDPRLITATEYPNGNIWLLGWTAKV